MAMADDRRQFQRISFDAPVSIQQGSEIITTEVIDISLRGILVKNISCHFNQTQDCNLSIKLSDAVQVNIQSRLVYGGQQGLGFEFHHVDLESMTHLRRILELNSGDESLIERAFSALRPKSRA
jgi:hypothetical protein